MAEPHWTAFVGMATGIIGAITGISGAIMGYVSYKKSQKLKALDLRLELKKNEILSSLLIDSVVDVLEQAESSYNAVSASRGRLNSGATEQWMETLSIDTTHVIELKNTLSQNKQNYDAHTPQELENEIVRIFKTSKQLESLKNKYQLSIEIDNGHRERISEAVRFKQAVSNPIT